jgi:SAM-dependent methyltransferase
LRLASGYDRAWRVTSDCKPWPPGGRLALCLDCGLVQTVVSRQWEQECQDIYRGYTIYHQSGGAEQPVFDHASGASQSRSEAIINAWQRHLPLPAAGRWLDIGCGNGALLRACSRGLPGAWTLCGSEVSDKYRELIESIPRVERLYTCALDKIPGAFDVISLIHVVEHIPGPGPFLRGLAGKLKPGGLLLLEVPDCRQNSFALMIADHCSHFSSGMLACIAEAAGYEILQATVDWVPKEITVLARKPAEAAASRSNSVPWTESEQVFGGWESLQRLLAQVESLQGAARFGIFGTSIAATWLDAQTGRVATFFVDEDPQRAGKQHLGRPVFSPADVPEGATVVLALAPVIARRVGERLRAVRPDVPFVSP